MQTKKEKIIIIVCLAITVVVIGLVIFSVIRSNRETPELPTDTTIEDVTNTPDIPAIEPSEGEESGNPERRENAVLLREALLELEPSDRELMIRRYFYGESVKEAAGHLGFTAKYAENRLFRSRQKLKKVLLERGVIV